MHANTGTSTVHIYIYIYEGIYIIYLVYTYVELCHLQPKIIEIAVSIAVDKKL